MSVAAIVAMQVLLSASPAMAEFKISKPKAKPPVQASPERAPRARPVRRTRAAAEAGPPEAPSGIDPSLMEEAVVGARYSATLTRDEVDRTAVVQATDNKIGWSVNFSDCTEPDRCQSMEFYTRWEVPNEANVCTIWNRDVTMDPSRTLGKPFCYTVPGLGRQLHLKLTSRQLPYAGIERLDRTQAKQRMESMIKTWTTHLQMLPQAWTIAQEKCPRASDKCP